jgi:aspartate 1-decarboxylase
MIPYNNGMTENSENHTLELLRRMRTEMTDGFRKVNTGQRLETYVIEAPEGSGEIGLNGAAARGAAVGDVLIIAAWVWRNEHEPFAPAVVLVDDENRIKAA